MEKWSRSLGDKGTEHYNKCNYGCCVAGQQSEWGISNFTILSDIL